MVYTIEVPKVSLNAVRERAELPLVTTSSMDEFEKAVWVERYFELAFENKMWFDMIGTSKVRNDMTKDWDNSLDIPTSLKRHLAKKTCYYRFPKGKLTTIGI